MSTDILGSSRPELRSELFRPTTIAPVVDPNVFQRMRGGFLSAMIAAADPLIHIWLFHHGYLKHRPTMTLAQNVNNRRLQLETFHTLYGNLDAPAFVRIADAIFRMVGVNPEEVPTARKALFFLQNAPVLAPTVYTVLGPQVYDQLFGRAGSPMLLAKSIIALYAPYGIDSQSAQALAAGVHQYFLKNPHLRKGFTTEDIARMLELAVKHGLFYPTLNPDGFVRQAANIISLFATVRDRALREGKKEFNPEEGLVEVVKLYQAGSGVPFPEMLRRARVSDIIRRIAPYGVFQAAVQLSGKEVPISPEIYAEDDIKLRQNAADSPVGNMVGATIRAVERMKVGGPLRKFYERIRQEGRVPVIGLVEWLDMAVRSGLDRGQAFRLLLQTSANKAVLTPEIVQAIRSSQLHFDILPVMNAVMAMEKNPELQRGAISELAARLGYRGVGMMDPGDYMMFLHSPLINRKAKEVFDVANRLAITEEQTSGVSQIGPVARITDALLNRELSAEKPLESWLGVAGFVGPSDVSKLTGEIINPQRELLGLPQERPSVIPSYSSNDSLVHYPVNLQEPFTRTDATEGTSNEPREKVSWD